MVKKQGIKMAEDKSKKTCGAPSVSIQDTIRELFREHVTFKEVVYISKLSGNTCRIKNDERFDEIILLLNENNVKNALSDNYFLSEDLSVRKVQTFKYYVLHKYYTGDLNANCKNKEIWKQHRACDTSGRFERARAQDR